MSLSSLEHTSANEFCFSCDYCFLRFWKMQRKKHHWVNCDFSSSLESAIFLVLLFHICLCHLFLLLEIIIESVFNRRVHLLSRKIDICRETNDWNCSVIDIFIYSPLSDRKICFPLFCNLPCVRWQYEVGNLPATYLSIYVFSQVNLHVVNLWINRCRLSQSSAVAEICWNGNEK